jgi:K+ transporter
MRIARTTLLVFTSLIGSSAFAADTVLLPAAVWTAYGDSAHTG